ncbi:MAG: methyl-accepting chemotaxis protein, partial [Thermodesulfobacteriota bacterium]
MLKNISIRNALIAVVGILAILLVVNSGRGVMDARSSSQEAERMKLANDLVDNILVASGQEAIERGVSAAALGSKERAPAGMIQKINTLRSKGDAAFKRGMSLADKLAEIDPSNEVFIHAIGENRDAYSAVQGARRRVDANLSRTDDKDYTPNEIIQVMSEFIFAGADMRSDAVTSPARTETLQGPLRMNAEIKQAVFLASEYAGRERAVIGGTIATGQPVTSENMEKLRAFRAINQLMVGRIMTLRHDEDTDTRILQALSKMSSVFGGSFENVRQSVYAELNTGNYPMSAGQWVNSATEGINTILEVSDSVSIVVKEDINHALTAANQQMTFAIIFLVVSVLLAIIAFVIIRTKITQPLNYLNQMMGHIESTGDLTSIIEVRGTDETGTLADSFNKMIHKFHDITREMQGSADHLASAAEEYSATASSIARGTEEQAGRADHVATASQQMNATIVEVAKNASGAAEAAQSATDTATEGGNIVSKTIDSMNGIALTAKESSEVIATLGARSQEIGTIIKVIEDIADQTNLLALNAA